MAHSPRGWFCIVPESRNLLERSDFTQLHATLLQIYYWFQLASIAIYTDRDCVHFVKIWIRLLK